MTTFSKLPICSVQDHGLLRSEIWNSSRSDHAKSDKKIFKMYGEENIVKYGSKLNHI